MRIYLVRHAQAQTRANLNGIVVYDNQKNKGLTKKGEDQAKKLAEELNKVKIDKIFISEAERTYKTILPLLKFKKDIPVKKDKRLDESKYGIFSGLTFQEAGKKYPKVFKARLKNKWDVPIPKGESFKGVAARFNSFLNDLEKEGKKSQLENVLIVTHATNLEAFLIKYLGLSIKKLDSVYFENASLSVFDFKNRKIKPVKINVKEI